MAVSGVDILLILGCLIQPLLSGGLMTRLLSFGLDTKDKVAESTNKVREGLEDRWLELLRGIVCIIATAKLNHMCCRSEVLGLKSK